MVRGAVPRTIETPDFPRPVKSFHGRGGGASATPVIPNPKGRSRSRDLCGELRAPDPPAPERSQKSALRPAKRSRTEVPATRKSAHDFAGLRGRRGEPLAHSRKELRLFLFGRGQAGFAMLDSKTAWLRLAGPP